MYIETSTRFAKAEYWLKSELFLLQEFHLYVDTSPIFENNKPQLEIFLGHISLFHVIYHISVIQELQNTKTFSHKNNLSDCVEPVYSHFYIPTSIPTSLSSAAAIQC